MFKKLSLLLLLCAMTCGIAKAAYWTPAAGSHTLTTSGNGIQVDGGTTVYDGIAGVTITSDTYTITFNTTQPVKVNGVINVQGGTLTMQLGGSYSASATLIRNSASGHIFNLSQNGGTAANLVLKGTDANTKFVVDGNAKFSVYETVEALYEVSYTSGLQSIGSLLYMKRGTADLDYVTLCNNWNKYTGSTANPGTGSNTNGGAAIRFDSSADSDKKTLTLDYCSIEDCYDGNSGAAIFIYDNFDTKSSIVMNNTTVKGCCSRDEYNRPGSGGNIRGYSRPYCTFQMKDCIIQENYSWSNGGGINWEGILQAVELDGCTFSRNWAEGSGGAVAVSGLIDIKGCKFYDNIAYENGGGVAYGTYSTQANLNLEGKIKNGTITLDEDTEFVGNESWMGGPFPWELHLLLSM